MNAEKASEDIVGQDERTEASAATPPQAEATMPPSGETAAAAERAGSGAPGENQATAVIAQPAALTIKANEIVPAEETGRADLADASQIEAPAVVGATAAIAASGPEASDSLAVALAALDRRDYSTARRLFEGLGRKDAAEAIDRALAALDRKDFAAAQGLFEALAPPKLAPPTEASPTPEPAGVAEEKRAPAPDVAPVVAPEDRAPAPPAEKARRRGLRPRLLGVALAVLAVFGVSSLYLSQRNTAGATAHGDGAGGPALAVDLVKAFVKSVAGSGQGETERTEVSDLRAALAQAITRLDRLESEFGARLARPGEGGDPNSASRLADVTTRLDALEKTAAAPAAPAAGLAEVAARLDTLEKQSAVAGAPAAEIADLATRLDRLEKRAAVAAASPAKPVAPVAPKRSVSTTRAQPVEANDPSRPGARGRLLQDYAVEDVRGGMAVIDGRYGPQQVAPGDFIPGAGRVLRIERRGGDWVVLTSGGVIAGGQPPY